MNKKSHKRKEFLGWNMHDDYEDISWSKSLPMKLNPGYRIETLYFSSSDKQLLMAEASQNVSNRTNVLFSYLIFI